MGNQRIKFIKEQSSFTRSLTLSILVQTPHKIWYLTPEILKLNIAWQVGHLILSQFYHTIVVIGDSDPSIYKKS